MTMKLIQTITLSQTATVVEFVSIPQTFTDLMLLISARGSVSNETPIFSLRINTSEDSVRSIRRMSGDGTTVFSLAPTSTLVGNIAGSLTTPNTFGNTSLYFPNYSENLIKVFSSDSVSENNGTNARQNIIALQQGITAPITRLEFTAQGTPTEGFVANSTFLLYGITAGSDGITTVS